MAKSSANAFSVDQPLMHKDETLPIVSDQLSNHYIPRILFFLSSIEQAMHFLIVPMRERGVARSKRDIASAEPVKGDIIFSSAPSDLLKRTANTASLRHGAWPGDAPPIRPLLDARLTSMATLGFTLSGLEEVDGVLYAQSWYCREV